MQRMLEILLEGESMRTINELALHMKKFKDAVIIVGPDAIQSYNKTISKEDLSDKFSRKSLKRTPQIFWDTFKESIYIDSESCQLSPTYKNIQTLLNKQLVSKVITQTHDGLLSIMTSLSDKIIPLHGSDQEFVCTGPDCKIFYPYSAIMPYLDIDHIPRCEICGKQLRPSTLMENENYDDELFFQAKKAIYETHTLLVWGIDFGEEELLSLIAQYGDIKANENASGNEEAERVLVGCINPDVLIDVNDEIAFFEFLVKENCDEATSRFTKAITESNLNI